MRLSCWIGRAHSLVPSPRCQRIRRTRPGRLAPRAELEEIRLRSRETTPRRKKGAPRPRTRSPRRPRGRGEAAIDRSIPARPPLGRTRAATRAAARGEQAVAAGHEQRLHHDVLPGGDPPPQGDRVSPWGVGLGIRRPRGLGARGFQGGSGDLKLLKFRATRRTSWVITLIGLTAFQGAGFTVFSPRMLIQACKRPGLRGSGARLDSAATSVGECGGHAAPRFGESTSPRHEAASPRLQGWGRPIWKAVNYHAGATPEIPRGPSSAFLYLSRLSSKCAASASRRWALRGRR